MFNIAWGRDLGDDFEHITSNVSPSLADATFDLFFTDEIAAIVDAPTSRTLWTTDGTPNVR